MGKTARKIIVCAALVLVMGCAAIPLSTWLHLLLKGEYTDRSQLAVAVCLAGLAADKQHRMVYLLLVLVVLMLVLALWMMGRNSNSFESETVQITDTIRTPIPAGQGQHGTARWLKKKEAKKLFSTLQVTPTDSRIAALREKARQEQEQLWGKEDADEKASIAQ